MHKVREKCISIEGVLRIETIFFSSLLLNQSVKKNSKKTVVIGVSITTVSVRTNVLTAERRKGTKEKKYRMRENQPSMTTW